MPAQEKDDNIFGAMKLDSAESMFFARELEHLIKRSYDIERSEPKARKLIPMDTSGHAADTTLTYREYSSSGIAKFVDEASDDIPTTKITGKEFTSNIHTIAQGFNYSLDEIRAAAKTGKSLDKQLAVETQDAMTRKENKTAFFGDADRGLTGFLNHASVPKLVLTAGSAANATKKWSSKSADEIIADIFNIMNKVGEQSKQVEIPDTLALPVTLFNLISGKKTSTASDTTIMTYFLKNSVYIKNVVWLNELETAGVGNTTRIIAYKRSIDKLFLSVPQGFEMLNPQIKNFSYWVPCKQKTGGTVIPKPLSLVYADGA